FPRRRRRGSSFPCRRAPPENRGPAPGASGGAVRGRMSRPSQVLEVELAQVLERLFFLVGQGSFDRLAGRVGVNAPELREVFADVPFFLGAEPAERAAQENEGAFELFVIER